MFIVKLLGPRDIESCGFIAHSLSEMEAYVAGVSDNMRQYVYKVNVYSVKDQELEVKYLPRHGFDVYVPKMERVKEVCLAMDPHYRREIYR